MCDVCHIAKYSAVQWCRIGREYREKALHSTAQHSRYTGRLTHLQQQVVERLLPLAAGVTREALHLVGQQAPVEAATELLARGVLQRSLQGVNEQSGHRVGDVSR